MKVIYYVAFGNNQNAFSTLEKACAYADKLQEKGYIDKDESITAIEIIVDQEYFPEYLKIDGYNEDGTPYTNINLPRGVKETGRC